MSKQLSQPDLFSSVRDSDPELASREYTQPPSSRASIDSDSSELSSPPDSSEDASQAVVITQGSSPIKGQHRTDDAATKPQLKRVRDQFLKDMDGRFVKMNYATFLETFLPDKGLALRQQDPAPLILDNVSDENDLQTRFVSIQGLGFVLDSC